MRGYAICTAPRSGSNFLCQLLAATNALGRPLEYFNGPGRRFFDDPSYPDDPLEQLDRIKTMSTTPNGIYGLKIFAHQHDWISGKVRWTEHLPDLRFVFLSRRDLLGQAISWTRAEQTGQYRHTQDARAHPSFDADAIAAYLARIATEYARWDAFFARNGIAPVRLIYEEIAAAPGTTIDSVVELLELPVRLEARLDRVEVKVQRDPMTKAWRDRFLAERRDLDVVDSL